jgi:hypothetical protein
MYWLGGGFDACHGHRRSAFSGALECAKRPVARIRASLRGHASVGYDNARSGAGVVRLNSRLERISRYNYRPQRVECPSDQGRYRPVRDR